MSASGGVTLGYDGRDRLHSVAQGGTTTRFQYDGDDLIGEYNAAGALQRRYVHGPGEDEPLIWYDSADLLYKRTLLADERGSIIEVAKATPLGSPETLEFNDYDEYGLNKPGVQLSRFGYTGQAWIPQLGLYYYKARFYDPALGRFMQTDPIRLDAGMNMYAYVGGDPINRSDPSGMWGCDTDWGITDWLCEVGNKLFGGGVKCSGNCSAPFDSPDYRLSTSGGGGGGGGGVGGGGGLASVVVVNGGAESLGGPTPTDNAPDACPVGTVASENFVASTAASEAGSPTVSKPGAIAGGGKSGPVTSPASTHLRAMTGRGRIGALRPLTGTSSIGGAIGRVLPIWGALLAFPEFVENMEVAQQPMPPGCVPIV